MDWQTRIKWLFFSTIFECSYDHPSAWRPVSFACKPKHWYLIILELLEFLNSHLLDKLQNAHIYLIDTIWGDNSANQCVSFYHLHNYIYIYILIYSCLIMIFTFFILNLMMKHSDINYLSYHRLYTFTIACHIIFYSVPFLDICFCK